MCDKKIVLAITGASGVAYAVRLLEVLTASECDVHLVISPVAYRILAEEMGIYLSAENFDPCAFGLSQNCVSKIFPSGQIHFHPHDDFSAPIASGSYQTDGMVVCPCTTGTLGGIAAGLCSNLIQRAADVHLKEGRKLILVPRETPFSLIHLENMTRLARAGGVILPASPAFYHGVRDMRDIVNFIVSRICDQLGIQNRLIKRWKSPEEQEEEADFDPERFVEMAG
ncbi:MAG: flavin prenyltransferase UbiX [Planctomycetia bacterium]|nr:flavin prenyltransferase UbiX [Planctomycetia bacterium]